ncbi:MAG: radical SAM protein [Acidobacteriota bacterium]|nr:MAG: radical SAM protein [Acidobacteriota bacterium]
MRLSGLHLLLTLRCIYECDHCFVWGSPQKSATMTLEMIRKIIRQGKELDGCRWIYFEGGEPFLYYAALVEGVREAAAAGFQVGVVSNGYWATSLEDARESLRPFEGLVEDLTVSSDLFHGSQMVSPQSRFVRQACEELKVPFNMISVCSPLDPQEPDTCGEGIDPSTVRFRGRAAEKLVSMDKGEESEQYRECPYEELGQPDRVHIDPYGNLHVCQGIVIGNLLEKPLAEISGEYDPAKHPIVGPVLEGGPHELARRSGLTSEGRFNDACHLCYQTRKQLLSRHPRELGPSEMYGL